MPRQQFHQKSKFGLIVCIDRYDSVYGCLQNLPEVANDFKMAMQTLKMLGIPDENIVKLRDVSFDKLEWEF